MRGSKFKYLILPAGFICLVLSDIVAQTKHPFTTSQIGREVSIQKHLQDDEEFRLPLADLLTYGKRLFCAIWTDQEGGGRPLTKGTGRPLSDPSHPLVGSRSFNRISAPDANSCAGCHNSPHGIAGGGGDFVTNVFVLGQRFDFATFDPKDTLPTRGAVDEKMVPASLQTVANLRATTGMFGAGYLEMLARQMTADLQTIRDSTGLGHSKTLISKGIAFGKIARKADGLWDVSQVEGLPRLSLISNGSHDPPSLVIRPWHQAGNVVSLREFTNNAYNHHHGIQPTERFGVGTDPDGDGFKNEMTRADVTAVTIWQATLQVPGRVIPNDPAVERAVLLGEQTFEKIGCGGCHVSSLPLDKNGWVYSEPSPYNPAGNLRIGATRTLRVDLANPTLPQPRLQPDSNQVIQVPAFSDFKLHDICDPEDESGVEPLDMNQTAWSPKFKQGNRKFLTKRLWGAANEPPYFHHGLFTTLRQAVVAHSGEALPTRQSFEALSKYKQDSLIEFLKSLQVLPPGTKDLIVDENFQKKQWPPKEPLGID